MQLTNDEVLEILDLKNIPSQRLDYSSKPGVCEVSNICKTLEHNLPDNAEVSITIDDIRLKSNSSNTQTLIFAKKVFFLYNFRIYSVTLRSNR